VDENVHTGFGLDEGDVDAFSCGAFAKVNLGEVAVYAEDSSRKGEAHGDLRTIVKSNY
jgi:hypothetical protein